MTHTLPNPQEPVILNADAFKKGWPIPHKQPICAHCKTTRAFIVNPQHGLVCGKCHLELVQTNEDAIIQEAAKIVQRRQNCP